MLAVGVESTPWRAVDKATGHLAMSGPSMKRESRYTYRENDRGLQRVKYVPFVPGSLAHKNRPESEVRGQAETARASEA